MCYYNSLVWHCQVFFPPTPSSYLQQNNTFPNHQHTNIHILAKSSKEHIYAYTNSIQAQKGEGEGNECNCHHEKLWRKLWGLKIQSSTSSILDYTPMNARHWYSQCCFVCRILSTLSDCSRSSQYSLQLFKHLFQESQTTSSLFKIIYIYKETK